MNVGMNYVSAQIGYTMICQEYGNYHLLLPVAQKIPKRGKKKYLGLLKLVANYRKINQRRNLKGVLPYIKKKKEKKIV